MKFSELLEAREVVAPDSGQAKFAELKKALLAGLPDSVKTKGVVKSFDLGGLTFKFSWGNEDGHPYFCYQSNDPRGFAIIIKFHRDGKKLTPMTADVSWSGQVKRPGYDDSFVDRNFERTINLHPAADKHADGIKLTAKDLAGDVSTDDEGILAAIESETDNNAEYSVVLGDIVKKLRKLKDLNKERLEGPLMRATLQTLKTMLTDNDGYTRGEGAFIIKWINTLRHLGYNYPALEGVERKLHAEAVKHLKHDETIK